MAESKNPGAAGTAHGVSELVHAGTLDDPNDNLLHAAAQASREIMAAVAIMDGDNHLGELLELRCGMWAAADAIGVELGTFPDQWAAALAVICSISHRHGR